MTVKELPRCDECWCVLSEDEIIAHEQIEKYLPTKDLPKICMDCFEEKLENN